MLYTVYTSKAFDAISHWRKWMKRVKKKAQRINGASNTKIKHLKQLTAEFQNMTAHNVNKDSTQKMRQAGEANKKLSLVQQEEATKRQSPK